MEASVGALGHGLSIACGMAKSAKLAAKTHRIFAVLSDGECDEGSTWEAILFAGHHRLDNLTVIVDYNKLQGFGKTEEVLDLEPFNAKWESFKWRTQEIDGHDFSALENALAKVPFEPEKPSVIIAHTIKAKGIPFLENTVQSHYKNLSEEEYQQAIDALS